MLRRFAVAFALILISKAAFAPTQGGPIPVPQPLFPANNWWNTDVSAAPVDGNSSNFINQIGANVALHPDFGGDAGGGNIYGFPYIIVDSNQTKKTVTFDVPEESDGVDHMNMETPFPFYPIPDEAITMSGWVEGGPPGNVQINEDRHILIVDKTNNFLYELYHVWYDTPGAHWTAGSGAFFDMNTNNRRPETWTSADASGMAILPGLVRYDEVYGPNEITHAFRVTVNSTNGHVYPASHTAGGTAGAPPLGARLRLKASKDISGFTPDMRKIFRAFQKYGLIVVDNGSPMYISGTYDTRWNNDILNPAFGMLKTNDFEVVQQGWQPSVSFILTLPDVMGAGDPAGATLTAYDTNYNIATSYTGTIHFTSSDGAATPTGLTATATTATNVNLSWNTSAGAAQYEIMRKLGSAPYATLATTMMTSYPDMSVTANGSYVYKVRAIDSSLRVSPFSTPDPAITIFFTDDPLVANTTIIKAAHITEVRQAVNAMRTTAGIGTTSFTDPVLTGGVFVRAVHVQELRTALTAARAALGLPATGYTDPTLIVGTTQVKAVHVQELRNLIK